MTNLVKIERVVTFNGHPEVLRISAYAPRAPLAHLCTAELDTAAGPIERDRLLEVIGDFQKGNFPT